MEKNYLDWFEENNVDLKSIFDKATKFISKTIEECVKDEENDGQTKTYFSTSGVHYDHGKLIDHYEKEYVNGKCVKDIRNGEDKCEKKLTENNENGKKCKGKDACKCHSTNDKVVSSTDYESRVKELSDKLEQLNGKIYGLEKKNQQLSKENAELKNTIDQIKKCF